VGQLSGPHDRDSQWVSALQESNIKVYTLDIYKYENSNKSLILRFQNRLSRGPKFLTLQNDLLCEARRIKPDVIHYRMPIRFWPETINQLRSEGFMQTSYCNDDPFSHRGPWGLHWHYLKSIPQYDHHFLFRRKNIPEFTSAGSRSHSLLAPFFFDSILSISKNKALQPHWDAVFIGHWEKDGRADFLEYLAQRNLKVQVYGSIWKEKINRKSPLTGPFQLIFGPASWMLYQQAHVSICFFSKINNDQWTRRPLEIVAAGGLLVCERTAEAQSHFKEDQEALYFSSAEELYQQVLRAKSNSAMARVMRERALARLKKGRYSLGDRVEEIIQTWGEKIKEQRKSVF